MSSPNKSTIKNKKPMVIPSAPLAANPMLAAALSSKKCVEILTPFAYVKNYTDKGRMLIIFGKEYHAWYYDTYILDAIHLVNKWQTNQITYDRIIHLRHWIRENSQHGHEMCFKHFRSMKSVKLWLDELINREYQDEYWKEKKEFSLKNNAQIFSISENFKAAVF